MKQRLFTFYDYDAILQNHCPPFLDYLPRKPVQLRHLDYLFTA